MKLVSIFAILISCSFAQAGDQMDFRSIGFSTDSSKYAYMQSVVADGSGFPIASIVVMDIATGNVIRNEEVVLENENATLEDAVTQVYQKVDLASYGIDGTTEGALLINRLETDRSSYSDTSFSTGYYHHSPVYTLTTTNTPVVGGGPGYCFVDPDYFKLELKNSDPSNVLQVTLFEESSINAERGCGYGYNVSKVIVSKDALVVIMNFSSMGFEGPNSEYLAIVKKIDLP